MPPAAEAAAPEPEAGEQRPRGAGLAQDGHLGLRGPLIVNGQLLRDDVYVELCCVVVEKVLLTLSGIQ